MPRVDFSQVQEAGEFTPLPAGCYEVEVAEVDERSTKHGDELWSVRFVVTSGEHKDRYLFDNLVFSDLALKRVKLACSRLGLDVSGEIDLTPDMLIGRRCRVWVEVEEYVDDGTTKQRNKIPFAGYQPLEEGEEGPTF